MRKTELDGRSRRKYVPDVSGLHAECETNYARLMKIVPEMDAGTEFRLRVGCVGDGDSTVILFSVIESSRYTSVLMVSQVSGVTPLCDPPRVQVRVYHDARMAEVIDYQGAGSFQPSYAYPNRQMRQPNEKMEINRFLSDWLQLCLECGSMDEYPLTVAR